MLKRTKNKSERGIALLVALFALILIAAVGLGMIFSTNSEMSVNGSFRQNHLSYFAARSGLEEARDRMRFASTDATTPAGMGISDLLPTNPIGQANSVIYIVNQAGVNPTDFTNNTYFDDELCHEINNTALIPNSPGAYNIKCPHNASSVPLVAGWAVQKAAEPIPGGGGTIPYAWTRINLKLQESTNPWCVLGFGICNPAVGADAAADQVCYDGTREFVLTDAMPPREAPAGNGGVNMTSELAMAMFFGGSTGHGNSGHSTTSGTSTSGTSSTGTSSTGTSGSGTTGTSSTGTSSTGTSSTGTSSTGTSRTGTSSTGTSSTGTSSTGTSSTGTSSTGTSSTGTSSTGTSSTGTSSTGTSSTGTSSTGTSSTGTSSTGTSSTGTSSTGTSSTGSSTGSSSSGSSTGGTTGGGGGGGGACSGVYNPAPPTASVATGNCNNANSQPVYTLTTLAITPSGARRMLQYEIARIMIPPLPAAVTMAGPNPNFGPPHSANFGISGVDANSCSATGHQASNVPAIGTTTDVGNTGTGENATQVANDAATSIANTLTGPGVKTSNFTGAGCSTGDDVQNVINVAPAYNTVAGLNAVVQSVIGSADQVVTGGGSVSNWGTPASPQVIAIEGDANLSSGAGILLVTGNATASGAFSWTGLILVIGNGSLTFNGGGNGSISGSVLVANIGNSNYATDPGNSANLLPALGSPSFTYNGGGGNGITYDSCLSTSSTAHSTFKVLARREIVY